MSPEYEACVRTIFYHKKGKKVENEFKAGDLVFEIRGGHIMLGTLKDYGGLLKLEGGCFTYLPSGCEFGDFYAGRLFHATPENRQALVTLYGEDAVPQLPLRGSELTKKLLEKQKYVLCLVSHTGGDDKARSNNPPKVRTVVGVDRDWFESVTGLVNKHAVPIDNNGNEITEIE